MTDLREDLLMSLRAVLPPEKPKRFVLRARSLEGPAMESIDDTRIVLFPVFVNATGQKVFRQVAAMREEDSNIE